MISKLIISCLMVAGLMVSGCGQRPSALQPPDLHLGEDPCARCGMTIDDARFAAALVADDGSARLYDDIGDMLATLAEHPLERGQKAWVHDYQDGAWLDARAARFVRSARITTPMGGGVLAVADDTVARLLAARFSARVIDFETLITEKEKDRP